MAIEPSRQQRSQEEWKRPLPTRSNSAQQSSVKTSDTTLKTLGLLPEMHQSKGSTFTSIVVMSLVVLIIIVLGSQAKTIQKKMQLTKLDAPIPKELKQKEQPKPKPPPPKVLPPPPKIEPPKIKVPVIEVPEPPKIQMPVLQAKPVPVITPPAPKVVTPPPAPVNIALNKPQAASIANNSPHPTAIRSGSMTNPIKNTAGPAVSNINLGRAGAPGMNAANTGLGPASKINIGGSGSTQGKMGGTANSPVAIAGIKTGAPGGTGRGPAAGAIQIATAQPQQIRSAAPPVSTAAKTPPKVVYKPKPEYTAEARQLHLEGVINVRIHVSATGSVQVLGIVGSGLGHGLNEAALRAAQGLRFSPAMQDGHPVEWDGTVGFNFQQAGG